MIITFQTDFVHLFKGSIHYKFDPNTKRVVSTGPANDLLECKREDINGMMMWLNNGRETQPV